MPILHKLKIENMPLQYIIDRAISVSAVQVNAVPNEQIQWAAHFHHTTPTRELRHREHERTERRPAARPVLVATS
jgi:glucose dehydrogenase